MTEKFSTLIKLTGTAIFCFILVIVAANAFAQPHPATNKIREPLVRIGEPFPDFEFVISDHRLQKARISDFRGKVVVLDLMTNTCSSCMKMLPELDSIRNIVSKVAEIISVVPEDSVTMTQAVQHMLKEKYRKFPFVYNDKIFHQLFPFDRVPAFVWIDREGILRAITRSDYCRVENIMDLAAGKPVNWEIAVNDMEPDMRYPLLRPFSVAGDLKFYSMVTGELKNYYNGGIIYLDTGKHKRLSVVNLPINGLYYTAFSRAALVEPNVIKFFEFDYPSRKSFKYDHEYLTAAYFCYEATFPLNTSDKEMYVAMLSDLNRYFNLNGRVEKRELWCVVIKDLNPRKRISRQLNAVNGKELTISVRNLAKTYASVTARREYRNVVKNDTFVHKYPMPVILETQRTSADIPVLRADLYREASHIREILEKNGFKVVEERRLLSVAVVSRPGTTTRRNLSSQK